MKKTQTLKVVYSAFFLCLAMILPFFTGQIKILGKMLNLDPNAVAMAFELGAYGLVSGLTYKMLYKVKGAKFISLIVSMLVGRMVWGITSLILWSFIGKFFTFALFIKGAFIDSVVGIVLQLILVPSIIFILEKAV